MIFTVRHRLSHGTPGLPALAAAYRGSGCQSGWVPSVTPVAVTQSGSVNRTAAEWVYSVLGTTFR